MAFRSVCGLKSTMNHLKGSSSLNYATAATSKLKPASLKQIVPKSRKGDFVPVCMALGMIGLSTSLGIHTAMQQLRRAPNVYVKKSRRETVPEIVEPQHVAEEAEKFVNKSLFRKVAHASNTRTGDIYTKKPAVETLKTIYRSGSNEVNERLGCILDFNF